MPCDPLRQNLKTKIIEELFDSFSYGSNDYYYLSIGRTSESSPDDQNNTVENGINFWRQCLAHKRIFENDVSFVVPRINWTAGTVYDSYRDNENLFAGSDPKQFYVLVDSRRVYKIVDNNSATPSAVKPIETTTSSTFTTSDGYTWKYLYTIPENQTKFLTNEYMPVFFVRGIGNLDSFEDQYNVQQAAIDGGVEFVELLQSGDAFQNAIPVGVANQNRINTVVSSTRFTILVGTTGPSQIDGAYVGYGLKIVETGKAYTGQIRKITAYDGDTGEVTIQSAFSGGTPVAGDDITIIPFVGVTSGDGTGASFEAKIDSTTKKITSIEVVSSGQNYTIIGLEITPVQSSGIPTQVRAVLSPPGGHGANPVRELGCRNLMISTDFSETENNVILGNLDNTVSNDYYQIALLVNPTVDSGAAVAGSEGDLFFVYDMESPNTFLSDVFGGITSSDGKLIVGNQTGFRGTFESYEPAIGNLLRGRVIVKNPNGNFRVGEKIAIANSDFSGSSLKNVTVSKLFRTYNSTNSEVYRQTTRITVSNSLGELTSNTFPESSVVKGLTSGATGIVSFWSRTFVSGTGFTGTSGTLELTGIEKRVGSAQGFVVGENLVIISSNGQQSSVRGAVSSLSEPQIDYYSGSILWIQNLSQQINRDDDQREEIRMVIGIDSE